MNVPVFYGGLEYTFRAVYCRNDDIWRRRQWKGASELRVGITVGIICMSVEWGSSVSDGVDPIQNVVKCPRLSRSFISVSWRMDPERVKQNAPQ